MSNIQKSNFDADYKAVPAGTLGTYPAAATKTGTFTSAGVIVTGTGTKFLKEVRKGDIIYSGSGIRKVVAVHSDTRLDVNKAFAADITVAVAVKIVRPNPNFSSSIKNTGGTGAALVSTIENDSQDLPQGAAVKFGNSNSGGVFAYNSQTATLAVSNGEIF